MTRVTDARLPDTPSSDRLPRTRGRRDDDVGCHQRNRSLSPLLKGERVRVRGFTETGGMLADASFKGHTSDARALSESGVS
jgi:hypothetical protein